VCEAAFYRASHNTDLGRPPTTLQISTEILSMGRVDGTRTAVVAEVYTTVVCDSPLERNDSGAILSDSRRASYDLTRKIEGKLEGQTQTAQE
jgi:hypothetical protein